MWQRAHMRESISKGRWHLLTSAHTHTHTHTHTILCKYLHSNWKLWNKQRNSLRKDLTHTNCRCAATAQWRVSEREWKTTGTSAIYLPTIDTSKHVEVWKHLDLNPSSRWVGPGQSPNVGWWKSLITPVKVCLPVLCLPCFSKAFVLW